jgi:hypothetical protein
MAENFGRTLSRLFIDKVSAKAPTTNDKILEHPPR